MTTADQKAPRKPLRRQGRIHARRSGKPYNGGTNGERIDLRNYQAIVGDAVPLHAPGEAIQTYPVGALGPLKLVTVAIASRKTVDPAMAASSVLAYASSAVMRHFDLVSGRGVTEPTAIYTLVGADSGSRKTNADNDAARGHKRLEDERRADYGKKMKDYRAACSVYERMKRSTLSNKSFVANAPTPSARQAALSNAIAQLVEPVEPLRPTITIGDATMEALLQQWDRMLSGQILSSTEAAGFFRGAAFTDERKASSGSTLNALWDGTNTVRMRATGEQYNDIAGKRLAVSFGLQTMFYTGLLADQQLEAHGVLARFLLAAPPVVDAPFKDPDPADEAEVEKFAVITHALLDRPYPTGDDGLMKPVPLVLSARAKALWIAYVNEIERRKPRYARIMPTALKSASQALRLAAVMQVIDKVTVKEGVRGCTVDVKEISAHHMANGLELARWYLDERLRFIPQLSESLRDAEDLLTWLHANPQVRTMRDVLRLGPGRMRRRDTVLSLLKILEEHGWVGSNDKGFRKPFKVTDAQL